MKVTKKISGLILLTIILFSSAGISFYLHECSCRGTNLYSVGTGFSGAQSFCCCSAEIPDSGACDLISTIDDEGCCKDVVYFYLIPFGPDKTATVLEKVSEKILSSASLLIISEFIQPVKEKLIVRLHSPPEKRSGKNLIFFIQQIKIPFPVCYTET